MLKIDKSVQELAKDCILNTLENCENFENKDKLLKAYKSTIKGLGSMIIQNGLYGTVIFYRSKMNPKSEKKDKEKNKKADEKKYIEYILDDLCAFFEEFYDFENIEKDNYNNFLEFLEKGNLKEFQDRILSFVGWYRRYADIFIEKDKD
ncbi:hypothetical protein OSSY52_07130 [Tepiditoga spiralis]|uniref:CRISPR type III-B/RAMP module-associated protein Cmr5 n=1 Tax=Tepiditoga spiralis TaxID=2108365 RepID=A0A7G1G926_9BACT|nr:type III-B CRISPR module-associated protein Cmr5 [Tepiditoga spiralis]BBE30572.1 hypothetical protein OSSY52_07130 [Tepiditoga spiralis]